MPIAVLLVGSQQALSESLAERLGSEADLHVVGSAPRLAQAYASVLWLCTDVVLLDTDAEPSADELVASIAAVSGPPRIVLLASAERSTDVVALVLAGVHGWVGKSDGVAELLATIRGVAAGEAWIPPQLLGSLVASIHRDPGMLRTASLGLRALTDREREVLAGMVAGYTRAQIAAQLVLSESTVRTHAQNILRKLGVHSSLAAVALARRAGMTSERTVPLPAARTEPLPTVTEPVPTLTESLTASHNGSVR